MYIIDKNRPASKMIYLWDLSQCELNDFESFDKYLFTEEERLLPFEERFKKFIVDTDDLNLIEWSIAVPFMFPNIMVEYQINHYVLWGAICSARSLTKPVYFFEYNTGDEIKKYPYNYCYACSWSAERYDSMCKHCPIYVYNNYSYNCENNKDSYYKRWIGPVIEEEDIIELAEKMAFMRWFVQ